MNRVTYPNIQSGNVYSTCLLSVVDQNYLAKMQGIATAVSAQWILFDARISPKNFHMFVPCKARKPQQLISGNVTQEELKELYTTYMLKDNSESRKIYDKLKASAKLSICPLCGIYEVESLDHYLPKARYPLLSVNPKNLIPACQRCNGVKSEGIFTKASDQTLYPYNDDIKFYNTDWVFATITAKYGVFCFDFYPDPPKQWLTTERKRAINHFVTFKLRSKYASNAVQLVATIKSDIKDKLATGTTASVQAHYAKLASEQIPNTTFKAVYTALANDANICSGNF